MKYNTISTSSLGNDMKKSTLTIYTDPDFIEKPCSEADMITIRTELQFVQSALKQQTRRCRQLVAEYTKTLQDKECQYQSEKRLRDNQLAKVLRALLIFEARLKQEQKYISHQLNEKDYIIKRQKDQINKLTQHCKHCNVYYPNVDNLQDLDSSSEYVATDCQDYQSSNFESLGSSETYATTVSEKDHLDQEIASVSSDDKTNDVVEVPKIFQKNKQNSLTRRAKKFAHKKSVGTYFEVLKLRNDLSDDNTSNDFDTFESLPPESVTSEKIETISDRIENIFAKCTNTNVDLTEVNLDKHDSCLNGDEDFLEVSETCDVLKTAENVDLMEDRKSVVLEVKLSDKIPIFDGGFESNEWYASVSDQEDDSHCDIYRNNPVLECMNQILLQNVNDPIISPQVERKSVKNCAGKKVKFSDEQVGEDNIEDLKDENSGQFSKDNDTFVRENSNQKSLETDSKISIESYYETPVQKQPNFYETPQSIYSNDYEQILSKNGEDTIKDFARNYEDETHESHYYIDMETKVIQENDGIVRKSKILRTPPALPPKPANLVSKYKIQSSPTKLNLANLEPIIVDSEPDYCSISELNLPTKKPNLKQLNVVAECNTKILKEEVQVQEKHVILHSPKELEEKSGIYDPIEVQDNSKLIKQTTIVATSPIKTTACNSSVKTTTVCFSPIKTTTVCTSPIKTTTVCSSPIKTTTIPNSISPTKSVIVPLKSHKQLEVTQEIPKLPQVSEILIPEEVEKKEERITQDNYIKNNSQILKRSILVGSSVSSIISGFNNHQVLSEIRQRPAVRKKLNLNKLSSFECLQNLEKLELEKLETPDFDLSQNFEEFKLDDCEIGEEFEELEKEEHVLPDLNELPDVESLPEKKQTIIVESKSNNSNSTKLNVDEAKTGTRVELVRATNDVILNATSVQQLRKQLERENKSLNCEKSRKDSSGKVEPTYEHFLECTGLSSKSILTPSRLLSNHKSMLKPKDVKLRSKVKNSNVFERQGSTIKYWSEPFI